MLEVTKQLNLNGEEAGSDGLMIVHGSMTTWKRPKRGRSREAYTKRFDGQVVAVITQQYIRLTPEAVEGLGASHVTVWNEREAWGFKPARPEDPDAYPLKKEKARKGKRETGNGVIYCADFVKAEKMPNGFYFVGVITSDYALAFEKTPSGKV